MSYAQYSFLRTVGSLAGNQAFYAKKLEQHQRELDAVGSNISDLRIAARRMAESYFGPTDELWERRYREGAILMCRELNDLGNIKIWTANNTCRFLELAYFVQEVGNDRESMNHVARFDLANSEKIGSEAWCEATRLVNFNLEKKDRLDSIKDAKRIFESWYSWIVAKSYLTRIAEVIITLDNEPDFTHRKWCELEISARFA